MARALSNRRLKERITALLRETRLETGLAGIRHYPARRAVNPLFTLLLDGDELLRWRAVTAMGAVVARLAEDNLESARVVIRRMLWMLNDESGGIGWGVPEAMGEVMARSAALAGEYACMLSSYCREDQNYLEHPILQRGVVWGLGRLAHARPAVLSGCGTLLLPYLQSADPTLRGTAAWAAGAFAIPSLQSLLAELTRDAAPLRIYLEHRLRECSVADLAHEALQTPMAAAADTGVD